MYEKYNLLYADFGIEEAKKLVENVMAFEGKNGVVQFPCTEV